MATKFVYSDTEIAEIVAKYQAGISVDDLATQYSKSVASVRMKLVKLGMYVAKGKTSSDPKSQKSTTIVAAKTTAKAKTKAEISHTFNECLIAVGPAPF